MKRKLFLLLCALLTMIGVQAQTDVTSTYITNPSFESDGNMSASNSTNPNMIQPTGWTQEQTTPGSYQNNQIRDAETDNASNFGKRVTPSNGSYYLFYRHGWNGNNHATFTSTSTSLPAGIYTLSVDYKMVSASDNGTNNDNTSITLSAISGETTLSAMTVKGAVQANNKSTPSTFTETSWKTVITNFVLTEETNTKFVIDLLACGPQRSDFVVDNVKLLRRPLHNIPTEYSEPGNGDFYIVNAATGMPLGTVKNGWGTQAGLAEHGIPFTVTVGSGTYTLNSHTYNSDDAHFFNGTYVDGGSTNVYITSLGSGKYSISTAEGSKFVTALNNTVVDNSAATASSAYAQWYFVSKENLENALASATETNPVDATFYIADPDFSRNYWPAGRNVSSWTAEAANKNLKGGDNGNMCAETYQNGGGRIYQALTGLLDGKYLVKCQGFHNGTDISSLYANNESVELAIFNAHGEGTTASMSGASAAFSAGQYQNQLEVTVTDGQLTVGIENAASNWACFDNFELYYLGEDISAYIELYNSALAAAKSVAESTQKMSTSVLAALNSTINTYDTGKVSETKADLIAAANALNAATAAANTSIHSYAVIAAGVVPDNSIEGWVCENTNTFHVNTWSIEGNPGNDPSGMVTPFIENWVANGSYLGAGKVYYQLQGLNPGEVYYASALVRSYNEANTDAPNGPNFFVNNETVDMTTAGTTFVYNNGQKDMSGIYATLGIQAEVGNDGVLKLGVEIAEDRNYNWVSFKSVKIQELSTAYNEAVDAAKALEGKIPTPAYAIVSSTLDECSEITISNINTINNVVATYSALVSPFAAFNALKPKAETLAGVPNTNSEANAVLVSAIATQNTAANNATTADGINTATTDLKAAMVTYAGAADPTSGNRFDLTFMLTNPDLTGLPTWTGAAGWYTDQTDGNSQVMVNDGVKSDDGKNAFYEYWSESPKANGEFTLYQKVELPVGTYSIQCYAFSDQPINGETRAVYFYANDTQGSLVSNSKLTEQGISFINDEEQEVKIGLKALAGNTYRWMGIGYVELYKEYTDNTTYAINVEDFENATVAVTVDDAPATSAKALKTVKLTYTPDAKYCIESVAATYNDGVEKTLDVANPEKNVYTFQMPAYDVTVVTTVALEKVPANLKVNDGKLGTFVAPFDVTLPDNVKAYSATVDNNEVKLSKIDNDEIEAGTPVIVYGDGVSVDQTFYGVPAVEESKTVGNLVGILSESEKTVPAGAYVLQTQTIEEQQVQAFYKVSSDAPGALNRCYLISGSGNARLTIKFDDTTAINAIEAAEAEDGALKDGKYLIDGKIILVKNGVKYSANGQILK